MTNGYFFSESRSNTGKDKVLYDDALLRHFTTATVISNANQSAKQITGTNRARQDKTKTRDKTVQYSTVVVNLTL